MRNDLTLYERHAAEWWDPRARAFASLRRTKEFQRAQLGRWLGPELAEALVVELGCGGGLLLCPLALHARAVVGIDLSLGSLAAARDHLPPGRRGLFARGDALAPPLAGACADVVLISDVLEHVREPARMVAEAGRLLRPGGLLYVFTLNRTWRARLLAVHLAKGIGLVPRGTHDPALFLRPQEVRAMAQQAGLLPVHAEGAAPRLLDTLRSWAIALRPARALAVSYGMLFVKGPCPPVPDEHGNAVAGPPLSRR
ncbi:MAG: methyltransferase domain-containing protein [Planctomycetes bacterium]|nr:methyltransferase domain-containing protein [Planctomycetota bacterium]